MCLHNISFFLLLTDHQVTDNMQRRKINYDLPSTSRAHNAAPDGVAKYNSHGVWHCAGFVESDIEGPSSASIPPTPVIPWTSQDSDMT